MKANLFYSQFYCYCLHTNTIIRVLNGKQIVLGLCLCTALQGEARYDIVQFSNVGRSRYGDDTLEIAAAPRTQNPQQHL